MGQYIVIFTSAHRNNSVDRKICRLQKKNLNQIDVKQTLMSAKNENKIQIAIQCDGMSEIFSYDFFSPFHSSTFESLIFVFC